MRYEDNEAGIAALEAYVLATGGLRVAEKILADAKRDCPVDTGRLKGSLHIEGEPDAWFIGSDVEYAKFVEDGTSRMKGRHFLRRALYKRRRL